MAATDWLTQPSYSPTAPTAMPRCMPPTTCTQGVTTCTQGVLLRAHDGDAMLTLKLLMMIVSWRVRVAVRTG